MDAPEELKKWVESLSISEKRFIKLLGKARAGNAESQQLELLDWLNAATPDEMLPENAKFRNNLSTVSNRLKDLILDGLRLLHKEDNTDARLRTTLDEIAILYEKKLFPAVMRQLKRTKKVALDACRYGFALQCIGWEQKMLQSAMGGDVVAGLKALRQEELEMLKKQSELHELRYCHDMLRTHAAQIFVPRNPRLVHELKELIDEELVLRLSIQGGFLERMLTANILGVQDLLARNPLSALLRYEILLKEWQTHPEWQADQTPLLLYACNCYQIACFQSPVKWEEAQAYLALLNGFKALSRETGNDFQRLLYHNQFILTLNTGNFNSVKGLIQEIDQWLAAHQDHLAESQVLPFLYNFAIAEFLSGNLSSANRFVQRILNSPNRKLRTDIREFSLVLEAILQYEMDDKNLDEYLTRAGNRHFSKEPRMLNFELAVFKYLNVVIRTPSPSELQEALTQLVQTLDVLTEQPPGTSPLIGLAEVRLWAQAKQTKQPLKEIFLQAVKANLQSLGKP